MRQTGIIVEINCNNCKYRDRDEKACYKLIHTKTTEKINAFCPTSGFLNKICEKYVPRKSDIKRWIGKKRKESANENKT